MAVTNPETTFTIYVYEESHIVRTGLLKYYNPLLLSSLYGQILSTLSARDDTVPSSDPAGGSYPNNINANILTVSVTE